jgi:hypothetical protein
MDEPSNDSTAISQDSVLKLSGKVVEDSAMMNMD